VHIGTARWVPLPRWASLFILARSIHPRVLERYLGTSRVWVLEVERNAAHRDGQAVGHLVESGLYTPASGGRDSNNAGVVITEN
jgi:hypothetical protein